MSTSPEGQPDCGHCGMPIVGYASVDGRHLCHPDSGMDCYRLVSVYHHDMPCVLAPCLASVVTRRRRQALRIGTIHDDD